MLESRDLNLDRHDDLGPPRSLVRRIPRIRLFTETTHHGAFFTSARICLTSFGKERAEGTASSLLCFAVLDCD